MSIAVVISGAPASGKTHLARELCRATGLPLISKDNIKETLADAMAEFAGQGDGSAGLAPRDSPAAVKWSQQLGNGSFAVFTHLLGELMVSGSSFIAENAFRQGDTIPGPVAGATLFHLHCVCAQDILLRRFAVRASNGSRHSSHLDHLRFEDLTAALDAGVYGPVAVQDHAGAVKFREFITDDPAGSTYQHALEQLHAELRA